MLWTAPEILRNNYSSASKGSRKGDVYSFAIIMQEVLYRALPYFQEDLSPQGKNNDRLPS